jgi:proteasome alpha subunit
MKPMEVEILVAEVGLDASEDRLFHVLYDGTVIDEHRFSVLGGESDSIAERMDASYVENATLDDALRHAASALAGPDRTLVADDLEVAVLARGNDRRAFRRLSDEDVAAILPAAPPPADAPAG